MKHIWTSFNLKSVATEKNSNSNYWNSYGIFRYIMEIYDTIEFTDCVIIVRLESEHIFVHGFGYQKSLLK